MHLTVSSPWHRARKEGTDVPGRHGNIVDTRYGGWQGVGTQKWTAVGEAGFLVCSCLWAQGQGSGPRVGGFVGTQLTALLPVGVARRSHEGIASSAALRLFGFFFFSVFTSGQSVCLQLVKTRNTRENNCDRAERPRAPGLEQAGTLPNTVLTVPSGPFPLSPRPDVVTVTRSPPPGPVRVLSAGTWHQPWRCELSGPEVSCHPSSQQVHSRPASL